MLTQRRAPQCGCRPLYVAAHFGHLAVVEELVGAGADMNATMKVGWRRGGDVGRAVGAGEGMLGARLVHFILSGVYQEADQCQFADEGW